ncbi:MAG: hypothetical protein RMM06_11960, partial [Armatimonadota bacterium]|nr:hypothetical protein [Armatimonadota bacterium]
WSRRSATLQTGGWSRRSATLQRALGGMRFVASAGVRRSVTLHHALEGEAPAESSSHCHAERQRSI